jgi:tetratricopeptide (TPR) repeat protein
MLQKQGRGKEAEAQEVGTPKAKKAALGPEHPNASDSVINLATTYMQQGKWTEAGKLAAQALAKFTPSLLGPESPGTLTAMEVLAKCYDELDRSTEAEQLQLQILEAQNNAKGKEHQDTMASVFNQASTLYTQKRGVEAEKEQAQMLGVPQNVLGPDHKKEAMLRG